jgi:ABC-type dipeptide/oligopeptide/nickel transport system permease subunit
MYTRLLYGTRISTYIAISTTFFALSIAIPIGMISGYVGGKVDQAIVGFMDILLSFPSILLALVLVAILGVGLNNLILAIGIYSIPVFIRLIRGATLSVKESEYVKAAQMIGENGFNVVLRYILPNISPVIIVQATIRMGLAILSTAALGFLGLGVQTPLPEWGVMVADARVFIFVQPLLIVYPGIFILLFTLGFNLMGDGLNDLLNPRLRTY